MVTLTLLPDSNPNLTLLPDGNPNLTLLPEGNPNLTLHPPTPQESGGAPWQRQLIVRHRVEG